jgi:DNA-directed RNA polymerase specialized sigma24 family protein
VDADFDSLIDGAVQGDANAWGRLWTELEPMLERLARSPRVTGRLSGDEDECRNIVVEVMSRLRDDDFRRLRLYQNARHERPDLTFKPWITVVAKRVAVDYIRGHGEYIDRRRSHNPESAPGRWVQPRTLPGDSRLHGLRPAMTNHGAAMTMLRYAYRKLPEDQLAALEQWITGAGFDAIASTQELDSSGAAEKLVRAALRRLRRHFREKSKS